MGRRGGGHPAWQRGEHHLFSAHLLQRWPHVRKIFCLVKVRHGEDFHLPAGRDSKPTALFNETESAWPSHYRRFKLTTSCKFLPERC